MKLFYTRREMLRGFLQRSAAETSKNYHNNTVRTQIHRHPPLSAAYVIGPPSRLPVHNSGISDGPPIRRRLLFVFGTALLLVNNHCCPRQARTLVWRAEDKGVSGRNGFS